MMDDVRLRALIEELRTGLTAPETAEREITAALKEKPFEDLGFARIDHHREVRQGIPEVIYSSGKTPEQVARIARSIHERGSTLLATRASIEVFEAVRLEVPAALYNATARIAFAPGNAPREFSGVAGVICAGTSDLPVAEEAACTLEVLGATVERVTDVGVAGLHRLLANLEQVRSWDVVIVVAGMEGALPSVVGGLVEVPVIAVPTSVGYGASFGGLAALLGMLNSCASGVVVTNIDNGFGAAMCAAKILRKIAPSPVPSQ